MKNKYVDQFLLDLCEEQLTATLKDKENNLTWYFHIYIFCFLSKNKIKQQNINFIQRWPAGQEWKPAAKV